MTDYTLAIPTASIYERLDALTHYTAAKDTADAGAFERVATIAANAELFDLQLDAIARQLLVAGAPGVTACVADTSSSGTLSLSLSMPDNWDGSLLAPVRQAAVDFAVASLAAHWFTMTKAAAVTVQQALANAALSELRLLLHHRRRPTFSFLDPYDDGEDEDDDEADDIPGPDNNI
jgi:hypothetical protein